MSDTPRVEFPQITTKEAVETPVLVEHFSDWIKTVKLKRANGEITEDQENNILARSMAAMYRGKERMKNKAYTDALTGLPNRRAFDIALKQTTNEDIGVLILDLDHFKKVNDKYGHLAGDNILSQIAMTLSTSLRQNRSEVENDFIARYGGEEMVVILRDIADKENVREIAEKLRRSVGSSPFAVSVEGTLQEIPITVSIGAGLIPLGQDRISAVEKVDKHALYQAKAQGRNQTFVLGDKNK